MFEAALERSLKQIFRIGKVSYNTPSETPEQNVIFVQVETCAPTIRDAKQLARVTGKLHVYAPHEKLPYGFFGKALNEAEPELTKQFYFFDFEENTGTFLDIAERSLSFVFFFDSQYNPRVGTITELTVESVE